MEKKVVRDYITVVQETQDVQDLYQAQIQLELLKGDLFKIRDANHDEVTIMADISLATVLQDVARERQKDLQEKQKAQANKDQQFAYNFLRNAPYFINEETFNKISASAILPRSVFRDKVIKEKGSFEKIKPNETTVSSPFKGKAK